MTGDERRGIMELAVVGEGADEFDSRAVRKLKDNLEMYNFMMAFNFPTRKC